MIILSLDQSLRISGYAIYEDNNLIESGTFTIPANKPIEERLLCFWKELNNLYNQYDFNKIVFENIQYQNNAETYRKLAYVQSVILLWCVNQSIKFEIMAPSHWRSILKEKCGISFGRSRAEQKKKTQELVRDRFNIEASEDECDAIAIGLAAHLDKKESAF